MIVVPEPTSKKWLFQLWTALDTRRTMILAFWKNIKVRGRHWKIDFQINLNDDNRMFTKFVVSVISIKPEKR